MGIETGKLYPHKQIPRSDSKVTMQNLKLNAIMDPFFLVLKNSNRKFKMSTSDLRMLIAVEMLSWLVCTNHRIIFKIQDSKKYLYYCKPANYDHPEC